MAAIQKDSSNNPAKWGPEEVCAMLVKYRKQGERSGSLAEWKEYIASYSQEKGKPFDKAWLDDAKNYNRIKTKIVNLRKHAKLRCSSEEWKANKEFFTMPRAGRGSSSSVSEQVSNIFDLINK